MTARARNATGDLHRGPITGSRPKLIQGLFEWRLSKTSFPPASRR